MKKITKFLILVFPFVAVAQNWQQKADYQMVIKMNAQKGQYSGSQKLTYTNNSPDTLSVVFYHLYYNAFQPNSEMDGRLQSISDPDRRMVINHGTAEKPIYQSKIAMLKPSEIGYISVKSLTQNGKKTSFKTEGTILKVTPAEPILPHSKVVFEMEFDAQVPLIIRRAGRNSPDGVAFSVAQWFPKIAAYDQRGWHPNQYIGREFYSPFGDYDVKITIDKNYIVAATGSLQNASEISYVIDNQSIKKNETKTNQWHFKAENVHDFSWAADTDFQQDNLSLKNGKTLRFFYKKSNKEIAENWKKIQPELAKVFDYFNNLVGEYPWNEYSFIQAGDGGMEYAMCTFVAGGKDYNRLLGTCIHELAHAWFQHLLATDESSFAWMDEGFTSFIEDLAMQNIVNKSEKNPFLGAYQSYFRLVKSGLEEPAATNADRFNTNYAYSTMAYSKGTLFLTQLGYIIGNQALMKSLKAYYQQYKFKHPTPNDFVRIAEKQSKMQLQWFLNEFISTTHTADYAIEKVVKNGNKTKITLKRVGELPLPIDIFVSEKSGEKHYFYIPLRMQYGEKENPYQGVKQQTQPSWGWGNQFYEFEVAIPFENINEIAIDPMEFSVDVDKNNNIFKR